VRAGRQADRQACIQADRQTLRQSDRRNRWAEASGKDVIEENTGSLPSLPPHITIDRFTELSRFLSNLQPFQPFQPDIVPVDNSFVSHGLQQKVLAPPSPPRPLSRPASWADNMGRLRKRDNLLTKEGAGGLGRSQIIHRRESLAFYESFNALWAPVAERLLINTNRNRGRVGPWICFCLYFSKG
jgi:hypothetical protein